MISNDKIKNFIILIFIYVAHFVFDFSRTNSSAYLCGEKEGLVVVSI